MTTTEANAQFWQRASVRLARWVNFGWWLSQWITWWMVAGLAGSVAILVVRRYSPHALGWTWAAAGTLLLAGAIAAFVRVRGRFESAENARVRLEDAHSLKARLSAAAAGVGAWPAPIEDLKAALRFRWHQPAKVMGIVAGMLALASFVPISRGALDRNRIIEKPPAAQDVQQWVDKLREKKAVSKESLDAVDQKIDDLLRRPSENWYEHGSLEAAGSLKEQTSESLREMARNLAEAQRAANALAKMGNTLPQGAKDALSKSLGDAENGLRSGDMKPNEELLQQMQQEGGNDPSQMSQEDLDKLSKNLKQAMQDLKEALENSPELKMALQSLLDGEGQDGDGDGDKDGDGDDSKSGKPGRGGKGGGGTPAPLTLKQDPTDLGTNNKEKLKSKMDPTHVAPGDMVGISDGKHKVDQNAYHGPQDAGGVNSTGEGGAAVWQNSLVPEEREALKKYFK